MISNQSAIPVPIQSPIFGPAYVSRSSNLSDQECINVYPEIVETHTGKQVGALYGCPGLELKVTVGPGPIRGMIQMGDLLYVVSGSNLYSLSTTFGITPLSISTISNTPSAYLYSLGTIVPGFSVIALPFTPPGAGSFVTMITNGLSGGKDVAIFVGMSATQCDGFGLVNQPQTYNFFQSNEVDFSTWPPLQFAQASGDPDPIVALGQIRREVFIIKEVNLEVWNNNGTANFTFGREQGPYDEAGCAAPASLAHLGETLFWLAKNRDGQGIVVKLVGYSLQRVSTHYIEREIQSWPTMSDAIGYSYQQEGHEFYVLTSPSGDQTWVYDDTVSTMTGIPMWHQRQMYSTTAGTPQRQWGNCYASFAGFNLIGDYRNGNIYAYNLNIHTDNGQPRRWVRSWRAHREPPSGRMVRFNSLILDMQTGIDVPVALNPVPMLRWSDDGGHTWAPQVVPAGASGGRTGQTAYRVKFNRLGALRYATGYDRIFELSGTDPIPVAIIGALLE